MLLPEPSWRGPCACGISGHLVTFSCLLLHLFAQGVLRPLEPALLRSLPGETASSQGQGRREHSPGPPTSGGHPTQVTTLLPASPAELSSGRPLCPLADSPAITCFLPFPI